MNQIEQVFKEKEKVLIHYISGGDPNLNTTKKIITTLDQAGAKIIEIGIPYSDPLADGPVIQAAGQRALAQGVTLEKIIKMLSEIVDDISAPLVLMLYYNNILKYGRQKFIKKIKETNIKGVIIPDLPYEQDPEFYKMLNQENLAGILLAAPNTAEKRLNKIGKKSSGFLYCVSLLGVTGDKKGPDKKLKEYMEQVRDNTNLPLGLGFGIDGPQKAKQAAQVADGIIIGSAIIKIINKYQDNEHKMLSKINSFIDSIIKVI